MTFSVNDSLLGPEIELLPQAGRIKPPIGFEPIPDSLLAELQKTFSDSLRIKNGFQLIRFLADTASGSSFMISRVNNLNLKSDTSIFMSSFREALNESYSPDNISSGDFWHENIFIKNFLVTDGNSVQFHLICFLSDEYTFELFYMIPRENYRKLAASIESSIGSLNYSKAGG